MGEDREDILGRLSEAVVTMDSEQAVELSRSAIGAMISFEVERHRLVEQILSRVQVFLFAESLGDVESLITFPAVQTHGDVDEEIRERLGINDRLLRFSIGIEAVEELIADLDQAMG